LPGNPGDLISLDLKDIGETAARIVRRTTGGFAVEFCDTDAIRDALIRRIYCRGDASSLGSVSGRRVFQALVARALR
jgi:hypothetical protein